MKTKPFDTLKARRTPAEQKRVEKLKEEMRREMSLREVREALQLTQVELASSLHLKQAAVSKIERQADMYLSTLRRFLGALGADLRIVAVFPDREIDIEPLLGTTERKSGRAKR